MTSEEGRVYLCSTCLKRFPQENVSKQKLPLGGYVFICSSCEENHDTKRSGD